MFEKLTIKSSLLMGALALVACKGVCGDGVIDEENKDGFAEGCDDGNATPGDGCNAVCSAVESGFECPTAGQACIEINNCGNNAVDAGEQCDGADLGGVTDCTDVLFSAGAVTCNVDCTFNLDACTVANGDGIRTPTSIADLINATGEECDDGNQTAGDGCENNGTLTPNTSTITVAAGQAQLNNTDTTAATFSVFFPIGGVDLDGSGTVDIGDAGFDIDQDGAVDTSLLMVFTTDRSDICDLIFDNGGVNGFAFGAGAMFGIEGTFVVTMLQIPGADSYAAGTFTGTNLLLDTPNTLSVDSGYTISDANDNLSDTTFGSNGVGSMTIGTFTFDQVGLFGNITGLTTANVVQTIQFLPAQVTIDQPIAVTINAAASCSAADILQ